MEASNVQVLTVSWQAVSVMSGALVMVVGAATVYLRLFTQNQLNTLQLSLMDKIEQKFQDKEMSKRVEEDFRTRIAKLEGAVFKSP